MTDEAKALVERDPRDAEIAELKLEILKLRGALTQIANIIPPLHITIARAALAGDSHDQ